MILLEWLQKQQLNTKPEGENDMTLAATTIPGYLTGTWTIDTVHSDVSFTVRHMMVSKVRGSFRNFSGTIVTGENPLESSVTAEIDLNSIDTNNEQRDNHIRSADFFEVEKYATMTYKSTSISGTGENYVAQGDLTLKGITKNVPLKLELNGFTADPYGGQRAGFSATAEISRKEFGVDIDLPMDGGGVVIGDKISISLEIEAVLNQG
jgi:polyisoprenoid-binding protein YceI